MPEKCQKKKTEKKTASRRVCLTSAQRPLRLNMCTICTHTDKHTHAFKRGGEGSGSGRGGREQEQEMNESALAKLSEYSVNFS